MASTTSGLDGELQTLRANAWCGEPALGTISEHSLDWAAKRNLFVGKRALAPVELNLSDWAHPQVGWGVVLPDRDDVPAAEKSVGADAPEPIRALIKARGNAPVFRYRADLKNGYLRRYAKDGRAADLSLAGLRGTAGNAVPHYLLIVGAPSEIPWSLQYRLQTEAFTGRLDLEADGLARYVEALLGEWSGAMRDVRRPVIWAVDHGPPDITRLMRKTIAERLRNVLADDAEFDIANGFYSDAQATQAALAEALSERTPAFIATSSHGATFPLDNPVVMRAQLGLPIDHNQTVSASDGFAGSWNPRGAIWYAHACCSAGCDAKSRFRGLVDAESTLGRTLAGIEQAGACTAPLPRALLGGANPLGAFIGHVEPTFDWTLRDPANGQTTSQHIINALYGQLHLAGRPPIGQAMSVYFRAVAGLLWDYADILDAVVAQERGAPLRARRARLIAEDRLAMVILGDPTVRLPIST